MTFNYFYGKNADQFSFYRIPKCLMTEDKFEGLSIQAKMLYGLLLDRMGMSVSNKWIDADNKVYVVYQISEIQQDMNVSRRKAIDYLKELENYGLIQKKVRGLGLPNLLYIKNFTVMQPA